MPFQIIRDDITRVRCDAIVNAANSTLLGGGGVDGAIHAAAGPKLQRACARLGGCPAGKAKITKGYELPCKYVIHTVGPVWHGGNDNEEAYLRSCYRESLALAVKYRCESVAFPLIAGGSFGYPKEEALQIAVDEIGRFLLEHELYVTLVVHDKSDFCVSRQLIEDITDYIDDVYIEAQYPGGGATVLSVERPGTHAVDREDADMSAAPLPTVINPEAQEKRKDLESRYSMEQSRPLPHHSRRAKASAAPVAAGKLVFNLDESFVEMLLRKIREKGMTDVEFYTKANIDRKHFSKMRSNMQYKPSKTTAIACTIALELPLYEAQDMLKKAGFALSHSFLFDVIIEYFIIHRSYNIFEINEVLYDFDQSLLGA